MFTYTQIRANVMASYPNRDAETIFALLNAGARHRADSHRWTVRHMKRSNILLARALYSIAREYARELTRDEPCTCGDIAWTHSRSVHIGPTSRPAE